MRIAIAGRLSLGGVKMRGETVARRLGWPVLDVTRLGWLALRRRFDVIVLVKSDFGTAARLRRACDRLVYDPLDAWQATEPAADPRTWWRARLAELAPDDVLATSPSCAASIEDAIDGGGAVPVVRSAEQHRATRPRVHLLPHHADPGVRPSRDERGPIVYAGEPTYLGDDVPALTEAAKILGRAFVVRDGRDPGEALRGASLSICLRLPPHDTPLNRICKPQVKLENAAAAGLPVLASDHPCVSSLRPEAYRANPPFDSPSARSGPLRSGSAAGGRERGPLWPESNGGWADEMAAALASPPLANPVTLEQHAERLRALVEEG